MHMAHGLGDSCTRPCKCVHIKLCLYLKFQKMEHLPGAHVLKSCTRQSEYPHGVQGAGCTLNFEHWW